MGILLYFNIKKENEETNREPRTEQQYIQLITEDEPNKARSNWETRQKKMKSYLKCLKI